MMWALRLMGLMDGVSSVCCNPLDFDSIRVKVRLLKANALLNGGKDILRSPVLPIPHLPHHEAILGCGVIKEDLSGMLGAHNGTRVILAPV